MSLLLQALRMAPSRPPTRAAAASALVAGGGGVLGSAVLESLLGTGRFATVRVLVTQNFRVAMNGLEPVRLDLDEKVDPGARPLHLADVGIVVFDRERHANGRELAFTRPVPQDLPTLAQRLVERGVRHLLVVLPHSPSSLPDALKAGLANLDEHVVAGLGFEHVVFVRSAQAPADGRSARWLQRLADGVLAQLRMMVASSNQPVRARKVAQFVVELAAQLPPSTPGTRVAPPELVWQAAQMRDPAALVRAWLGGLDLPPIDLPRPRL